MEKRNGEWEGRRKEEEKEGGRKKREIEEGGGREREERKKGINQYVFQSTSAEASFFLPDPITLKSTNIYGILYYKQGTLMKNW